MTHIRAVFAFLLGKHFRYLNIWETAHICVYICFTKSFLLLHHIKWKCVQIFFSNDQQTNLFCLLQNRKHKSKGKHKTSWERIFKWKKKRASNFNLTIIKKKISKKVETLLAHESFCPELFCNIAKQSNNQHSTFKISHIPLVKSTFSLLFLSITTSCTASAAESAVWHTASKRSFKC